MRGAIGPQPEVAAGLRASGGDAPVAISLLSIRNSGEIVADSPYARRLVIAWPAQVTSRCPGSAS
jgi:hypothetical protein